ncbi:uncharacterized protein LOC127854795 [Dreissena polymorpha]|uniref:Mab-21-like HhH/H2TH-like domain-containing protein n=1 Tax=Dreissena polymorpha TaxID=45954 RepID=A0A9D4C7Z2_DREPO|nr:uncharacterized protein LOC127854795 [Dreissena polymorpha]KAH3718779.1 hypothetical protein DPMN_061586 [Dreissena polymorpha]
MGDYLRQEDFTELSERLSSALEDMGVTWETVMIRRKSYHLREKHGDIIDKISGHTESYFHFGSQSEGTTTPGLQSDIDLLFCELGVNVMRTIESRKSGMLNVLMLKDDSLPPQHYILQVTRPNSSAPETRVLDYRMIRCANTVVLSPERVIKDYERQMYATFKHVKICGPSVNLYGHLDTVKSFCVRELMPEVQRWVNRNRVGQWPTAKMLEAARMCPCFLVPSGHPGSDTRYVEWRLSPNLIERLLVYSLNITHLKCYIVLKIIKKAIFNTEVPDGITSFHCKTALLYTVERTPTSIWKPHNLVYLTILCLSTMERWLSQMLCPHYILPDTNLFDGKLMVGSCRRLLKCVNSIIRNLPRALCKIAIDRLGMRLLYRGLGIIRNKDGLTRQQQNMAIQRTLDHDRLQCLYMFELNKTNFSFDINTYKILQQLLLHGDKIEKRVVRLFARFMTSLLASTVSSQFIRCNKAVTKVILDCFKHSLNTDVASTRLKLASMLYCNGALHAAARVLDDVEQRMKHNVINMCGCLQSLPRDSTLDTFLGLPPSFPDSRLNVQNVVFCVRFTRPEAFCVPTVLLYEMNRAFSMEDLRERDVPDTWWMNDGCVDALVFLRYMQYLTYKGLGVNERKVQALNAILDYIQRHGHDCYHLDTMMNLAGHCIEMEGKVEHAKNIYNLSLEHRRRNNAANWHVERLSGL